MVELKSQYVNFDARDRRSQGEEVAEETPLDKKLLALERIIENLRIQVDRILGPEPLNKATEPVEGCEAALTRILMATPDLRARLTNVADRVGRL